MHSDSETGEEDTHSVHEIDEHVWTSPVNAALIVDQIKQLLIQADPSGQAVYEENAAIYEEKLTELDQEFRRCSGSCEEEAFDLWRPFPVPVFCRRVRAGLLCRVSGCAGDTEPSAATMAFLIDKVKEEKVPAVLKMELSNDDIANAVAEAAGTRGESIYSCHNLSAEDFESGETYLSMMQKNVETLEGGFELMALIRCENVSIGYEGQTVVRDLEFSIDAGDYLCIVGENGSGKSTLVRSILGLKNVEKGTYHLRGRPEEK